MTKNRLYTILITLGLWIEGLGLFSFLSHTLRFIVINDGRESALLLFDMGTASISALIGLKFLKNQNNVGLIWLWLSRCSRIVSATDLVISDSIPPLFSLFWILHIVYPAILTYLALTLEKVKK